MVQAEIMIHDELLMLNDFGDNDGISKSGGYQLSVRFNNEEELKAAYSGMQSESITISSIPTEYSPCTIRFIDKFDVRWAFWV